MLTPMLHISNINGTRLMRITISVRVVATGRSHVGTPYSGYTRHILRLRRQVYGWMSSTSRTAAYMVVIKGDIRIYIIEYRDPGPSGLLFKNAALILTRPGSTAFARIERPQPAVMWKSEPVVHHSLQRPELAVSFTAIAISLL